MRFTLPMTVESRVQGKTLVEKPQLSEHLRCAVCTGKPKGFHRQQLNATTSGDPSLGHRAFSDVCGVWHFGQMPVQA